MCSICPAYCVDCGIDICFDVKRRDDFAAPAYVTESGDLRCSGCGREIDEEERMYESEYGYDFDYSNSEV